jgi:hypothetical protein
VNPNGIKYIVSVKPAPGHDGPTLVSDDPAVVRAVLDVIRQSYEPSSPLRVMTSDPEGAA